MLKPLVCLLPCLLVLAATPASAAQDVRVTVSGTVIFNQINGGALGGVMTNELATLTFLLDSTQFVDSTSFPTRGYEIDQASFSLSFSGGSQVGLQDPFPAGETPFFVLRDNDPAVDGFFTATSLNFPTGVPVAQPGMFTQFINNYAVTYGGTTLSSLDLLDALGTYDFSGLSVFNWNIDDGPFQALGIDFASMVIEAAGPQSYCTPAAANSVSPGGAMLLSTSGYLSDSASFEITETPDQFGLLFTGDSDPGMLPFGCGQRCVGGPAVVRYGPFLPNGQALTVTIDMSLAPGNGRIQWWYRDPSFASTCGDTFNLSNALTNG